MKIRKYGILILVLLHTVISQGGQTVVADTLGVTSDTAIVIRKLPDKLLLLPSVLSTTTEGRTGDLFRGGQDDGFAASCLPPKIIEYGPQQFWCIQDSIVMWVKAQGTELIYKWQKYDAKDFRDLDETADYVRGVNTDRLVILTSQKLRDDGVYRCLVSNVVRLPVILSGWL